jgi:hypothetical protein
MPDEQKYWFPAKRYGWGWGLPCSWQGWVAVGVFSVLLGLGSLLLLPQGHSLYLVFVGFISVAFVVICWLKGEPPKWRWGKR